MCGKIPHHYCAEFERQEHILKNSRSTDAVHSWTVFEGEGVFWNNDINDKHMMYWVLNIKTLGI